MRVDGDNVKFRNGRVEYANCGVIGMSSVDNDLIVSGGYDSGFPSDEPLTKIERVELAEYMIIQWKIYAEKAIR